jgi:hypothetical protein
MVQEGQRHHADPCQSPNQQQTQQATWFHGWQPTRCAAVWEQRWPWLLTDMAGAGILRV